MSDKQIYGKSFEFDNDFFASQKQVGFVKLYQLGEVCFESGHEVELHRQVCHEVTYIISGRALVTCGDTSYRVGQGDIVINAKGQMHAIQADPDSKLRYFYLGFDFDRETHNEMVTRLSSFYEDKFNSRVAHDEYNLITCFGRLLDEIYNSMDFSEMLIRNYIEQILIMVYRTFQNRRPIPIETNSTNGSVGDTTYLMIRYIEDHILSINNLTEISNHLGYSYNYLSHLFKRKMGVSIQTYLNYKKIAKAVELIDSGRMSLTDISAALNYQTVQAFSKSFRKVMNMAPSEYKKSVKSYPQQENSDLI